MNPHDEHEQPTTRLPGPAGRPAPEPTPELVTEPTPELVTEPATAPRDPSEPVAGAPRARRGIRVRTVVFGLVMLVISGAALLSLLTKTHVEPGVVMLGLLIGAGAGLLVGGLSAAVRDVRDGGTRFT